MIKRNLYAELKKLLVEYPVVSVLGPRQAGKTTLVRQLKGFHYVNLEDPEARTFAQKDPKAFLKHHKTPLILDEIQRTPSLLSYIQVQVDERNLNGQFILTGSHQPQLGEAISQSLAGRVGLLKLLPLCVDELAEASALPKNFYSLAYKGFLPRVYDKSLRPQQTYANYYQTYVERDVQQLINLKDYTLFHKFMHLLAGRAGQVINYQSLANDVGVTDRTVKQWLSILEASFIVYRLCPYFNNFNKRATKAPKYYFIETGLLVYLLGLYKPEHLTNHPLIGQVFENLVVIEFLKTQLNSGSPCNLYFYREHSGVEIDLLCPHGQNLNVFEVKSASTYNAFMSKKLDKIKSLHPKIQNAWLVYNGNTMQLSNNMGCAHFQDIKKMFEKLLSA